MSHLRPEDRSLKSIRASCRKGRHFYGESQNIGAGITRQVCQTCGEVTIDLTGAYELTEPIIRSTGKIGTRSSER
ncbi:MAG TPA: hypothetical protein VJ858_01725 [Acidimicrobiia bacterium]|nr:hypothetical protein [Acidimicrobiia bacterium]